MDEIDRALLDAWNELVLRLLADPREATRRYLRRFRALMSRPLRYHCLVLRANDIRISRMNAFLDADLDLLESHGYDFRDHPTFHELRIPHTSCALRTSQQSRAVPSPVRLFRVPSPVCLYSFRAITKTVPREKTHRAVDSPAR